MDVFALSLQLKEEGAATVNAAVKKLGRSFEQTKKDAGGLDGALNKLKSGFAALAGVVTAGAVFKKIIDETSTAQFAQAQLAAALQSTGNAAGQTVDGLNDHATALSRVSTFGDDAISKAQALLLTFTRVGGDTFPRATQSIVDMATAMGTDLQSATIQIGKALNAPVQGVTALARAGIQFSEDQKAMIASLVESNQLLKAQDIILKELETQFGGSAKAARDTLGGAIQGLQNEFGNLFEVSAEASVGMVNVINAISRSLESLIGMLDKVVQFASFAFVGLVTAANTLFVKLKMMLLAISAYVLEIFSILETLPGVGNIVSSVMNRLRMSMVEMESALVAERESWKAWESQQYQNIFVAKKTAAAMRDLKAATAGTGGARKETPSDVAKRIGAEAAAGGAGFSTKFKVANIDSARLAKENVAQVKPMLSETQVALLAEWQQLTESMGQQMGSLLTDSFASAFENLTSLDGSLKSAFGALTNSLLSGLGGMLISFGRYAIIAGKLMAKVMESLKSLNPAAGVAAGLAMIAIGGMLRGAASRSFGGGTGGAGAAGGFSSSFGTGSAMGTPGLFYGPTAAGSASTIQQMPNMNVTIIGPNDPSAQRQMQELMRNANRRGNV